MPHSPSPHPDDEPSSKRPRLLPNPAPTPTSLPIPPRPLKSSTLDQYVSSSKPNPKPVHVTGEIEDRESIFKALVFKATTTSEVARIMDFVKHVFYVSALDTPTHNITAWRFLTLKKSRDGLKGPEDYEIQSGSEDDGEKWAGAKVLRMMESHQIVDAVVIVSRWFGGTMLGPSRFNHIETCASDACKVFKSIDALDDDLTQLTLLDAELDDLRAQLKQPPQSSPSSSATVGSGAVTEKYAHLRASVDLKASAKLIAARQQSITLLRKLIHKAQTQASKT